MYWVTREVEFIGNLKKLYKPFAKNLERGLPTLLVSLPAVVFIIILVRTAWLSDDAYLTFRTVDNFVNGYGLTWNTAERVQVYTHPLWMFVMSAAYFITHEIYFTSIALSIFISMFAVFIFIFRIAATPAAAFLGLSVFIFSKSFVDYSTSGLENPLTHLLIAAFLAIHLKSETDLKKLFLLSLFAGLATLNRMDTILLFFPALLFHFFQFKGRKRFFAVIAGFLPFICWEIFSLFYYGFLFPNTAYAKLNTGIPKLDLVMQGFNYYSSLLQTDPLTLVIILLAILVPLFTSQLKHAFVPAGIALYLVYIISIGGDFMNGRFFTGPLFCAVAVLSQVRRVSPLKTSAPVFFAIVFTGFITPFPSFLSGADFGLNKKILLTKWALRTSGDFIIRLQDC